MRAGLSLTTAAARARVAKSSWQSWEEGGTPNVLSALRVAAALGTSAVAIWGPAASSAGRDRAEAA